MKSRACALVHTHMKVTAASLAQAGRPRRRTLTSPSPPSYSRPSRASKAVDKIDNGDAADNGDAITAIDNGDAALLPCPRVHRGAADPGEGQAGGRSRRMPYSDA